MKTKLNIMLLAFAAASVNLYAAPQAPPAPLPQFMDKEQLTQWSAAQAATAKVASSSQDTSTQFYTGKPYVADAGGYIFKYRTYNPEMSRWTSADPSGFPDGANNTLYAAIPLNQLDPTGLAITIDHPTPNPPSATYTDSSGDVFTVTVSALTVISAPSSSTTGSLGGQFGNANWSFTGGGSINATVQVSDYGAFIDSSSGGVNLAVTVTGYNFINLVNTNSPLGTNPANTPYPDGHVANSPYTGTTNGGGETQTGSYEDGASRSLSEVTPSNPVTWTGDTYFTLDDGNGNYTMYGGIEYSFTISE
jgi:RHS repeat-associated protein